MTQTNNKSAAVEVLTGAQKGDYKITPATARLLDCLRAGSAYYEIIADAMQLRYGDALSDAEVEEMLRPYLDAIDAIGDRIRGELDSCVTDALLDLNNTAANTINI